MPLSRLPQLDPYDIKLLRIFLKVVECGGFSGAQAELNVSATMISTHMATLESRLGMRLCERGRGGFRLTDKGRRVCAAAAHLEDAIGAFRTEMGELRGKLVGELTIGMADCTATNPEMRLQDAISLFTRRDNAVHVTLHVDEPDAIERKLLDGKLNLGVSAFYHHVAGLTYEHLLLEEHRLYCGRSHPFFGRDAVTEEEVQKADYVTRGYMMNRQAGVAAGLTVAGTAYNMEAALVMIRSGAFFAHLPSHYAREWVMRGEIWEVPCSRYTFSSSFEIAYRNGSEELRLVRTFLDDLIQAHATPTRSSAARRQARNDVSRSAADGRRRRQE
jgi:DNA-binding transcriptional LysR family regulator